MCSSSQFTKMSQNSFKRLVWPPNQKHLDAPTPDSPMPIVEVKVMYKIHTHIKETQPVFQISVKTR